VTGLLARQGGERARSKKPADVEQGGVGTSDLPQKGERVKEELDELLDELADHLEENAEEFVASYVQRGGQ